MGLRPVAQALSIHQALIFLGLPLTGSSSIQSEEARYLAGQSLHHALEPAELSLGLQYVWRIRQGAQDASFAELGNITSG